MERRSVTASVPGKRRFAPDPRRVGWEKGGKVPRGRTGGKTGLRRPSRIVVIGAGLVGGLLGPRPVVAQTFDVPSGQTQTVSTPITDGASPNSVTKTDSGTLALTAVNTYTGSTKITGGTLSLVAAGSIATSTGVALTASGTTFDISGGASAAAIRGLSGVAGSTVNLGDNDLAVREANSATFAGTVAGTGTLTLQGPADLDLTGNAAGFSGTTAVTGGTLTVGTAAAQSAILGGDVSVQSGAMVAGHGTILGSLTNTSGTVQPGGSIGTLNVSGNYVQDSSGTLLVQLNPNAASKLAVGGSASLAGKLALAAASGQGYVPFSRFTILTAGDGVDGTFGQITGAFPVLPVTLDYQSNAVNLVLGGFVGLKGNETAVAGALNAAFPTATGDFARVLDAAVKLPAAQMQQSLSSFGGQIYGNLAQVSLQNRRLFLGAMDDRIRIPAAIHPPPRCSAASAAAFPACGAGAATPRSLPPWPARSATPG